MEFEDWWKENWQRCRGWKYKKTAFNAFKAGQDSALKKSKDDLPTGFHKN